MSDISRHRKCYIKLCLLIFSFIVSYYTPLSASWTENGWIGVKELVFNDKNIHMNFNEVHNQLLEREKKLSSILPPDDKTNIVLAIFSIITQDPQDSSYKLKTLPVVDSNGKQCVFESGWTSIFNDELSLTAAKKIIKTYNPKIDSLKIEDQDNILSGFNEVVAKQKIFQEEVIPFFHFFKNSPQVDEVIKRFDSSFCQSTSIEFNTEPKNVISIRDEFNKNKKLIEEKSNALQDAKNDTCINIQDLTTTLAASMPPKNLILRLKDIQDAAEAGKKQIDLLTKDVTKIGSKIISEYWHSEQRLLEFIELKSNDIIDDIINHLPKEANVKAIFLNVHSRFDICSVCSHTFVKSYIQPTGIISRFQTTFNEKLKTTLLALRLTTSFREERNKSHFAISKQSSENFNEFYPAFPTCHIK